MRKVHILLFLLLINGFVNAQDWKDIPVPAELEPGMKWELQESVSDDFNYTSPRAPKSEEFLQKWDDWYHNDWSGPGLTIWRRQNSLVEDGELKLTSNRAGTNQVNLGIIHSNETIVYPVYIEGRAKIMNSVLANALWLLSPDDTQEIDFMEGYGSPYSANSQKDLTWFAQRMHMSHHVFIRQPFTDWQPKDDTSPGNPTWVTVKESGKNILWKDDYHTYGVYWKDPWHLYYYIDGKLVTKKEGKDEIDPVYHTNSVNPGDTNNDTRTGLNKPMDIIIDAEDQDWRSNQGVTPTNQELADTEGHTLKVDWIRTYKPVVDPDYVAEVLKIDTEDFRISPNPCLSEVSIQSSLGIQEIIIYHLNGQEAIRFASPISKKLNVSALNHGTYLLNIQFADGSKRSQKLIKQ
ncbi:MAG: T9SS type A sorting domain-containing protein [Cyclobacteriaceae bacterium]